MRSGDRLDALPILAGVDGQPNERTAPPARKGNPSSNSTTRAMSIRTGRILWSSGASRPAPAALAATRRGLSAWSNDSVPTGSVATLHELGVAAGEAYGDLKSLGTRKDGAWVWTTFAERAARADALGNALASYGVERGDRVAVISKNREEFVATMYGAYAAGAAHVPMYEQQKPEEWEYILNDSEAKVVFVSTAALLPSAREAARKYGKKVLCFEDLEAGSEHNFAEALDYGATLDGAAAAAQRPAAADLASLIYTSGTTGNPKAVELTHESARSVCEMMHARIPLNESTVLVSYLPLSHIAGQMMDVVAPILTGCTLHFARPDALKGSLKDTLGEVRPTVFFGVPRVWEKFGEAMKAKAATPGSMKDKVATFAKGCGAAKYAAAEQGDPDPNNCMANLVAGSIFGKIKGALGLDRCRLFATGAAPITTDLLKYFGSLDINILELFGMSEVTGPTNMSTADNFRVGKCGLQIPGTETACAKDTSEVIFRGRHVMMGYMYNQEATDKTIDADGWLHSGDVGSIDEDGYLKITGRIKEILITAAGENVAPVLIEDEIKRQLDCVANAMVVGDQKKFLTVLLTLKTKPDADGLPLGTELAKDAALCGCATIADAAASADYKKMIEDGLKKANANAISRAQNVQKFAILPVDFTQEGNELTPTMKLKRKVVLEKYADVVAGLY
mmetsp:Transcript_17962/g.58531  ORF Transcript_17962/g.58531 Transcript_17962/m.58531 type:complete len:680 (+) Transcript_17962:244-2283(+)